MATQRSLLLIKMHISKKTIATQLYNLNYILYQEKVRKKEKLNTKEKIKLLNFKYFCFKGYVFHISETLILKPRIVE